MAKRDIGTRISLDGEAEFKSAVKNIDQELRVLASEMGAATSAFDKNNISVSELQTKNEIYSKQIEVQKQKLSEQNRMLEECRAAQEKAAAAVSEAAKKYGEQSDEAKKAEEKLALVNSKLADYQISANSTTKAINKLEAAQKSNNEEIEKLQNADLDNITNDVKKLGDEAAESSDKWSKFRSGIVSAAKAAAAAVTAATAAVTAFAKSSIDAGMNFDSSMSQVAATMGTTVDKIGELRDFALEMGSKTAFSASQAADALNYMALAGYDAETSMDMLPNVLNLAAAGGIELASASDMVTDAQSALGLSLRESAELVDKMAMASSKSNTSVAQLGDAILTVGGTAKNLAGGTTELSTVLGILADNSVKGAEGGTALRNIILSLSAPTDTAAAAMERLGLEVFDAEGNMRPLNETFNDLAAALSAMTQGEQTQVLNEIFNKVDLKSVNALLANTGERFDELSGYIDDATGAAQAMADTQLDNLEGDITRFNGALEGAKITLSDQLKPSLREFVQFGTNGISQLTEAFKSGGLDGAMGKLGEIISGAVSQITAALPQVVNAAVSLLQALIGGLTSNFPQITEAAVQIIFMLTNGLTENLPEIVTAAMQMIETLASGIAEALPELIPTIVDVVLSVTEMLIDNVDMLIDAAVAIITGLADGLIDSLPILLEKLPEIIGKLVSALMEAIPELIGAVVEIFFKIRTASEEMIPLIIDTIAGMIAEIGLAIANGAKAWVESFEDLGGKIFDWAQNLKTKMREAFDSIIGNIKEAIQPALDIGKNIIDGIVDGIKERVTAVKDKVKNACSELLGDVKEFFGIHSPSTVFKEQIGENLAAGLSEGFVEKMGKLSDDMDDAVPSDYKIGINITDTSSAKKAIDTIVKDYQDGLLNKAQYDKLYTKTLNECAKKQINITEYANQKAVAADKKAASARQKNVLSIAKTQIDSIVKAYKDGEISLKEMEQLYTQVYKTCADERVEIEEYAGEKITAVRKEVAKKNLEQLKSDIKSQISEYEKQLEDIKKSSDSYASKIAGDISDLYTFSTDEQTGKVTANLGNGIAQKQQQLNKYYSDLQKLLDKGVSEEMLAQLADMSFDKGAAIAENWTKMDSAQLKNLENSFAGLTGTSKKIGTLLYSKQSEQVAGAMIDSLRTTIESSEEFADIGKNIMDGIIGGINGGDINSRLKEACDGIVNAFKDYFGIHSPSRLFRDEVGAYLAEGLGEGFTAQMHNVTKAMQNAVPTDLGSIDANVNIKSGSANSFGAGQGGITFNQYNNSPKALSRAGIARDTRRGLQLASLI